MIFNNIIYNYNLQTDKVAGLLYELAFVLFVITCPLFVVISNIFLIILLFLFLYSLKKERFFFQYNTAFRILWGLMFFLIIKSIFNKSFADDFVYYQKSYSFLLIPVLYTKIKNSSLLKNGLIFSVLLCVFVATIYLIKYYCVFHYFPLTEGLEVNQILKIERPYFGFLLIIGIVFCAELIVKSNTIQKLIYLTIALIFTGFMFFISARNAILTLSLLIIIYFIFFLNLSFLKKIFLSIGVLIAIGLIAANSSNFKTRIFYNKNPSEIIKNNLENEPRIIIWPSVFDATNSINFNCFVGFSNIKTANDSLTNSCVQRLYNNPGRAEWFKSIRYNSHNQFLSYYLIGGICGFSLIAIFFTTLFINHYKHFFEFAIIFAIFCFFVFENVLERQFGCQLTAILLSIIVFKK